VSEFCQRTTAKRKPKPARRSSERLQNKPVDSYDSKLSGMTVNWMLEKEWLNMVTIEKSSYVLVTNEYRVDYDKDEEDEQDAIREAGTHQIAIVGGLYSTMMVVSDKDKQKVKKAGVDFDAVSKCYTMVAKIKDDYDQKTRDSDKTKMEGFVWSEEGMKIHKIKKRVFGLLK
jgi:hypothetical protein